MAHVIFINKARIFVIKIVKHVQVLEFKNNMSNKMCRKRSSACIVYVACMNNVTWHLKHLLFHGMNHFKYKFK